MATRRLSSRPDWLSTCKIPEGNDRESLIAGPPIVHWRGRMVSVLLGLTPVVARLFLSGDHFGAIAPLDPMLQNVADKRAISAPAAAFEVRKEKLV